MSSLCGVECCAFCIESAGEGVSVAMAEALVQTDRLFKIHGAGEGGREHAIVWRPLTMYGISSVWTARWPRGVSSVRALIAAELMERCRGGRKTGCAGGKVLQRYHIALPGQPPHRAEPRSGIAPHPSPYQSTCELPGRLDPINAVRHGLRHAACTAKYTPATLPTPTVIGARLDAPFHGRFIIRSPCGSCSFHSQT